MGQLIIGHKVCSVDLFLLLNGEWCKTVKSGDGAMMSCADSRCGDPIFR